MHNLSLRFTSRIDLQPDGCWVLFPQPLRFICSEISGKEYEKQRHSCRCSPLYYLTAGVEPLISVALFGCCFSIDKVLMIIAFTLFVFWSPHPISNSKVVYRDYSVFTPKCYQLVIQTNHAALPPLHARNFIQQIKGFNIFFLRVGVLLYFDRM